MSRRHLEALSRLYNVADASRREGGAFQLPPAALEHLHSLLVPLETSTVEGCASLMSWGVSHVTAHELHGPASPVTEAAAAQLGAFAITRGFGLVAYGMASARRKGVPFGAIQPVELIEAMLTEQRAALIDAWNVTALAMKGSVRLAR